MCHLYTRIKHQPQHKIHYIPCDIQTRKGMVEEFVFFQPTKQLLEKRSHVLSILEHVSNDPPNVHDQRLTTMATNDVKTLAPTPYVYVSSVSVVLIHINVMCEEHIQIHFDPGRLTGHEGRIHKCLYYSLQKLLQIQVKYQNPKKKVKEKWRLPIQSIPQTLNPLEFSCFAKSLYLPLSNFGK